MIKKSILILIIILAALLRFWQLSDYPPHVNWDEASLGYNAYSILTTGRDEWGQFLPLTFRAFGDYKLPGYIYASVPPVAIFGLSEFSIRFASAFFGTLTVLLVFLLARLLTRKYSLSVIAAFLLAISPWHVFLSRIALEANLALFFLTLGIFLFVKFIDDSQLATQGQALRGYRRRGSSLLLIAYPLPLIAALYTYNSARVVVPLLVLLLVASYYPLLKKLKKQMALAMVLLVVLSMPAFSLAIKQDSSARYRWTAILDEGAINSINESRRTSAYPTPLKELLYNKITYTLPKVAAGYLAHFTPDFLYLKGGSNFQFNIPGFGLFYPLEMPFLVLGIIVAFWQKSPWRWLLVGWILIGPIPAAITRDAPHALRSLFMMPAPQILEAFGLLWFLDSLKKPVLERALAVGFGLIFTIASFFYWQLYTNLYTRDYSWSWQYGYKQAIAYVEKNQDKYQKIIFTKKYGEPHVFLLFYTRYPPDKYRNDPQLKRYFQTDWYWIDGFDKYQFINDWDIKQKGREIQIKNGGKPTLLIASPGNYPVDARLVESIYFLDGKKAFDLVEL